MLKYSLWNNRANGATSDTTLPTIWLYVRSESVHSNSHVSQRGDQDTMNKLVHTLKQTSVTQPPKSGTANSGSPLPLPTPSLHTASKSVDLCKVACVCSHFRSKMASSGTYQKGHCFGYLQSPCRSRYLYFGPSEPGSMCLSPASSSTDEVTVLKDVTNSSKRSSIPQYSLATISMAIQRPRDRRIQDQRPITRYSTPEHAFRDTSKHYQSPRQYRKHRRRSNNNHNNYAFRCRHVLQKARTGSLQ
jgi:hypothetical protein